MVIQYIATVIIVVVLAQFIWRIFKDKTIVLKSAFWIFFWIVALIFIWLPGGILNHLGAFFGVGRGVDVLIYLSIIILFYIISGLNRKIEKLEIEITKLVREIAKNSVQNKK